MAAQTQGEVGSQQAVGGKVVLTQSRVVTENGTERPIKQLQDIVGKYFYFFNRCCRFVLTIIKCLVLLFQIIEMLSRLNGYRLESETLPDCSPKQQIFSQYFCPPKTKLLASLVF